jgi:hypothetical protein
VHGQITSSSDAYGTGSRQLANLLMFVHTSSMPRVLPLHASLAQVWAQACGHTAFLASELVLRESLACWIPGDGVIERARFANDKTNRYLT